VSLGGDDDTSLTASHPDIKFRRTCDNDQLTDDVLQDTSKFGGQATGARDSFDDAFDQEENFVVSAKPRRAQWG